MKLTIYELLIRYVPGHEIKENAGYIKLYAPSPWTNADFIALDYPICIVFELYNRANGKPLVPDYAKTVITHEYRHAFGLTDEYYLQDDAGTVTIKYELPNDPSSKYSFSLDRGGAGDALMGNAMNIFIIPSLGLLWMNIKKWVRHEILE